MGNTTIIALNHDRFYEIERNQNLFIEEILNQMRCIKKPPISICGGEIVASFHRSKGKENDAWYKFKKEIGK